MIIKFDFHIFKRKNLYTYFTIEREEIAEKNQIYIYILNMFLNWNIFKININLKKKFPSSFPPFYYKGPIF
jgi:hypothetical protein